MADPQSSPQLPERRLAAILSADIAGYSRLMGEDEAATIRDLKAHQAVVLPLPPLHGGTIIDLAGDGILAQFPSAVRAVECAVAIQKSMAERNLDVPDSRKMLFRIGINVGDVVHDGERIYGDGINIAARLQAIAEPGAICISAKVHDEIVGKLGLPLRDLGERSFKNISRPVRTYELWPDGVTRQTSSRRLPRVAIGIVTALALMAVAGTIGFASGFWRQIGWGGFQTVRTFGLPSEWDLEKVKDIAGKHSLPLPANFTVETPKQGIAEDWLKFVGIWASDVGYNGIGRQAMLIVTSVNLEAKARGFYLQGPPTPTSFNQVQGASDLPFIGNIRGNTLTFEHENSGTVFQAKLDASADVIDVTVHLMSGQGATIVLRPVWKLIKTD